MLPEAGDMNESRRLGVMLGLAVDASPKGAVIAHI